MYTVGQKIEILKALEDSLQDCIRCGLCEARTNLVFGAGNVEAAGAVRGADHVPGQRSASEEVCTEVFRGPLGQQPAKSNDCEKITGYD